MIKEIRKNFGIEIEINPMNKPRELPLYLTNNRNFYKAKIHDVQFFIVEFEDNNKTTIVALRKQIEKYKDYINMPVVLYINNIVAEQRAALIRANIPFIAPPRQFYLPFLGIVLSNHFSKKQNSVDVTDKMMPITQSLFLYLFYNNERQIKKTDAKNFLKCTATSITRASEQLITMGLLEEFKNGTSIYMRLLDKGIGCYKKAKDYFISPVQKEIFVNIEDLPENILKAGETALAEKTMLSEPVIPEYAVYKNSGLAKNIKEISPLWNESRNVAKLQFWKYDPSLFATSGTVDNISIICSLLDNQDERIEMSLEELMEKI